MQNKYGADKLRLSLWQAVCQVTMYSRASGLHYPFVGDILSHIQKASSVIMTLCGVKMFNPPPDNWWSHLDERQNIFNKWITKSRWSSNAFSPWYLAVTLNFSCISGKKWLCKQQPSLFIMRSITWLINFMLSSEDYRCLCDFGCFRQRLGFICFRMVARSLSISVCTWPKTFSPFKSKTSSVCLENRSTQVWVQLYTLETRLIQSGKIQDMMKAVQHILLSFTCQGFYLLHCNNVFS